MVSPPFAISELRPCSAPRASTTPKPKCEVGFLSIEQTPQWDAYVRAHRDGTLFHTIAWRKAVRDTFGHEDLYLVARRNGALVGVLPAFFVSSLVAGRMLISVPYAVGGGILGDDEEAITALFESAKRIALERRCRVVELRSARAVLPELATLDRYVGFRRELPTTTDEVLGMLPRKARAAARCGRDKYGLTVSFGDEQLREVWRLYANSMKRLASLNYPHAFFTRLIDNSPDGHWVSVVRWQGKPVAGLLTFLYKDRVMPYFAGFADSARACCAGNFLYLTAMEKGVEHGFRVFDFGRSRRENSGSCDFKRFQGFEPEVLGYQTFTPPGRVAPNLSPNNPRFRLARSIWAHLPGWLTRPVGARLARHIPG